MTLRPTDLTLTSSVDRVADCQMTPLSINYLPYQSLSCQAHSPNQRILASSCVCVFVSIHGKNSALTGRMFMKFDICAFVKKKLSLKINFYKNLTRITGILYISVSQIFFKWGPLSLVRMFYGPPYSLDYQTHQACPKQCSKHVFATENPSFVVESRVGRVVNLLTTAIQ